MELDERLLETRIVALHSSGLAPSQIDSRLGLEPGTAHDVMVERWYLEKNARTRGLNDWA